MDNILPLLEVRLLWASLNTLQNGKQIKTAGMTAVALWYVRSGCVHVRSDDLDQTFRVTPGDAVIMTTNGARRIQAEGTNEAQWLSTGLSFRLFAQDYTLRLLPRLFLWRPNDDSARLLQHLMESALAHSADNGVLRTFTNPFPLHAPRNAVEQWASDGIARALVYQIWQQVTAREMDTLLPVQETPRRLLLALLHAQNEPATASVKTMAQAATISESHLTRLFRQHLNTTPQKQLLQLRLEIASFALRDTEETTDVIATRIGFASLSHFTRAFAKQFGLPPAKFRQQQRTVRW